MNLLRKNNVIYVGLYSVNAYLIIFTRYFKFKISSKFFCNTSQNENDQASHASHCQHFINQRVVSIKDHYEIIKDHYEIY